MYLHFMYFPVSHFSNCITSPGNSVCCLALFVCSDLTSVQLCLSSMYSLTVLVHSCVGEGLIGSSVLLVCLVSRVALAMHHSRCGHLYAELY